MAEFEIRCGNLESARKVFEKAKLALTNNAKEERLMLLEAWLQFESKNGDEDSYKKVREFIPFVFVKEFISVYELMA